MTRPDYARPGGPWDVAPLTHLPPPAVVDGEVAFTPAQVADRARALAGGLRARGVVRGDVVAFQHGTTLAAVVAYHACWAAGVVALPIHHRASDTEAERLARAGGAVLRLSATGRPGWIATDEVSAEPIEPVEVAGSDLAVLLVTSGSSGPAKLVRHTHRGLAGKAHTMVSAHGLTSADVVLMPAPLAHISGLLNGVLVPGAAAMRTVLMERWDAAAALDVIAREHVTFMTGPPTFVLDLLADPRCARATGSLRLVSSGGAAVTEAIVDRATDGLRAVVKRTYGSTEAPTVTTTHVGDDAAHARSTDGRPTTDVELRIVADGVDVPDGSVGEVFVRGPEIAEGYVDPDATAASFTADGWFRTGDLGTLTGGWLTIRGRASDTIIRGGENIAPDEIERACARLPGVRAVVAVGYPDERLGERVALVVEADRPPDLVSVHDACAAAGLARFAWPDRVVAVASIPRLPAGKPDRGALRKVV